MVRALVAAVAQQVPTLDLHEAVCAYVATLKAAGLPPERVLVLVKDAAREAGIPESGVIQDGPRLMEPVVRWCIEEYYQKG